MLHFAPFLSTPFELYALNPFSLFCVIFVQTSIFQLFRAFLTVLIVPHVNFLDETVFG